MYEKKPFISEELLSMDNVVLSPHSGTATYEGRNAMELLLVKISFGFLG